MDLTTRKYNFIRQLINIDEESIIEALERVLNQQKKEDTVIETDIKQELDLRLESYQKKPHDLLDWEDVKNEW